MVDSEHYHIAIGRRDFSQVPRFPCLRHFQIFHQALIVVPHNNQWHPEYLKKHYRQER